MESVNELAQIMKDLSVLVIDQGTIVDRIDHNIQTVATTVEEGLKQLQKVLSFFLPLSLSLSFFFFFFFFFFSSFFFSLSLWVI